MARDQISIKCTTDKKEKDSILEAFRSNNINMTGWVLSQLKKKRDELKKDES